MKKEIFALVASGLLLASAGAFAQSTVIPPMTGDPTQGDFKTSRDAGVGSGSGPAGAPAAGTNGNTGDAGKTGVITTKKAVVATAIIGGALAAASDDGGSGTSTSTSTSTTP